MSKKDNLLRSMDLVDQQIASLRVYLYDAELYPEQVEFWPRVKRSVSLFFLKRHVRRQIQQLHLRRRGYRNCYVYLFKEEPESRPLDEQREPVGSRR